MNALCDSGRLPELEWSVCWAPLPDETVSGDLHLICPVPDGALVSVVDGVGHGTGAAIAAEAAIAALQRHARDPLPSLLRRCDEELRETRGVVLCVAALDFRSSSMRWVSVGNVDAVLLRADPAVAGNAVTQYGGIVGQNLPRITNLSTLALHAGDRIIMTTDGLKSGFADLVPRDLRPADSQRVLADRFKGTDDALVLIAEYRGPRA